jgi:hypothetical protein
MSLDSFIQFVQTVQLWWEPLKLAECNGAPVTSYSLQHKEEGRDFQEAYSGIVYYIVRTLLLIVGYSGIVLLIQGIVLTLLLIVGCFTPV